MPAGPDASALITAKRVRDGIISGVHSNAPALLRSGSSGQISEAVLKQIGALETEKARRTPVQQKIDSQLIYAIKM
jgi:hypothetical protein